MTLRPYQTAFIEGVAKGFTDGFRRQLGVMPTAAGKCFGKGTPILMFDGQIKNVECVQVGDLLMGPDSLPRKVVSLAKGKEEMFEVLPFRGEAHKVNRSHILSLRLTGNKSATWCTGTRYYPGDIANVSVNDLLNSSKTFRHCAKLWKTGVDFQNQELPKEIPPYILGLWLGDGSSRNAAFANIDQEIIDEIKQHASSLGMKTREETAAGKCPVFHITFGRMRGGRGNEYNPVKKTLRALNLLQNKHIPHAYKTSSRSDRLDLMAGLIDSDGSLSNTGYDFISKNEQLAADVCFVARSLGFSANKNKAVKTCGNNGKKGTYYRVHIAGAIHEIPCRVKRKKAHSIITRKNPNNIGFKLKSCGEDWYYGFEIEGPDRLFLLGDFTVTHNTVVFSHVAARFWTKRKERTLILAHREELVQQAADKLHAATGLVASVEKAERHADRNSPVVVASVQTLQRGRLESWPKDHFGLVIVDEAHHVLAATFLNAVNHFDARVLGVTATPDRGDRKNLATFFDNLAYEIGILELVSQKYLSPLRIRSVPLKIDLNAVKLTQGDYDAAGLDAAITPYLGAIAREIATQCGDRKKIVAFLPLIATSEKFVAECRAAGIDARHVDGASKDRAEILSDFSAGKFRLLSNVSILTEGWDEPGVDCVLVLRPTRSRSLFAQMIGRGMRLSPEKENCLFLDFLWLHERHDLAKPASLVAKNKEEEAAINAALEKGEKDLGEAVEDAAAEREAALIRAIAENARKRERFMTLEQVGVLLKDKKIREYEPVFGWECAPVTEGQRKVLDRFGLSCKTKGEASMVMNRLFDRSKAKLATPKQLQWLVRYGHPSPELATAAEAKKFLDEKWNKKA